MQILPHLFDLGQFSEIFPGSRLVWIPARLTANASTMADDLSGLREEYSDTGLTRAGMDPDPIGQFDLWFRQACEAKLPEPNAMVLGTTGADAVPTTRLVLLKAFDERGFVFFTNYESSKSRQIGENPRVSLHFPWFPLQRQVNITGSAEKIGRAASLKYFLSRPHGSQLGAWISQQSSVISSRSILEMKFAEIKRKFSAGQVPLPDNWGGYRVVPESIEFWQGRESRLHDRLRYCRETDPGAWILERLAP